MPSRGERTLTQLEWFTVTYRSVALYVVVALVLLLAAGGFWYYQEHYAPRIAARSAIDLATERLHQAEPLADSHDHRETLERAAKFLDDGRVAFRAARFEDARFAALHSADLSHQALEAARGTSGDRRMVRFYRIEGDVRVKHAGEFSWSRATANTTLDIGDQVKTSSSASAKLIYFDGTVTIIKPGSLLEIRDLYEDPVTKVRRVKQKLNFGELDASTTKRNVNGSYHEVTTDQVAARSEEASEFRMSYDRAAGETVVDSFRGPLQVASAKRTESLSAGERIRAVGDRLTAKQALPGVPRLLAPADQRVFIQDRPDQGAITLRWEPVPGVARYHLLIADRPLFTEPLYDAERSGADATLEVGPGSYYWKVSALNDTGTEGPFCEPRGFRVSSEKILDRADNEPPALELTEFTTIGTMVIVNGRCEPGATLWVDDERVDIHEDGRFYTVVRLRQEGLNEILLRAQDTAGNQTELTRSAYVEFF